MTATTTAGGPTDEGDDMQIDDMQITGTEPTETDPTTTGGAASSDTVLCEDGLRRPPWAARDPLLREYYDTEWGMPVRDEAGLYERLVLEGFQSGLSWVTILRKRPAFREAFAGFDPDAVAAFGEDDIARLMADARIVRNRRKIDAAIANARAVVALRSEGGLVELVWSYRPERTPEPRTMDEVPSRSPESEALAKELKRRGFSFVGPVTVFALMEAIGVVDTHLMDSHRRGSSGVWSAEGAG
ncbi:DNA-3-methyladenine glycosylase I [Dietzia lutea]|nr:DNA-3-methyladenine glycosylase I [Dietzia lutea]